MITFRQNRNKSVRGEFGEIFINHKGKAIPTSVGSPAYESTFGGSNINFAKITGNIPEGYAHRPELIASLFMNSPKNWWMICERNAIFDVFEQLNSGDLINIPKGL